MTFLDRFPDQEACIAHLEAVRWPKGTACPKCGEIDNSVKLPRPTYWQCRACRAQFNVMNGTPMEGTHLPLRTWFGAIFLTATSSKGVSAMVISRQLDIGYKTAWFLGHRLRSLMAQDWESLRGLVEVDAEDTEDKVVALAEALEAVAKSLSKGAVRKIIYIKGRTLNFVVS